MTPKAADLIERLAGQEQHIREALRTARLALDDAAAGVETARQFRQALMALLPDADAAPAHLIVEDLGGCCGRVDVR